MSAAFLAIMIARPLGFAADQGWHDGTVDNSEISPIDTDPYRGNIEPADTVAFGWQIYGDEVESWVRLPAFALQCCSRTEAAARRRCVWNHGKREIPSWVGEAMAAGYVPVDELQLRQHQFGIAPELLAVTASILFDRFRQSLQSAGNPSSSVRCPFHADTERFLVVSDLGRIAPHAMQDNGQLFLQIERVANRSA